MRRANPEERVKAAIWPSGNVRRPSGRSVRSAAAPGPDHFSAVVPSALRATRSAGAARARRRLPGRVARPLTVEWVREVAAAKGCHARPSQRRRPPPVMLAKSVLLAEWTMVRPAVGDGVK